MEVGEFVVALIMGIAVICVVGVLEYGDKDDAD